MTYQILTYLFGGTSVVGIISACISYSQNKRIKEAEAKIKEAEAKIKDVDARKSEVELLQSQLARMEEANEKKDQRIAELNATIDKNINRRHELVNRICQAEQEVNHVNRLLNNAKDEIIRLTKKNDLLEVIKCERHDCQDPRGPKPPRKTKDVEYIPLTNKSK